jgi:hypothetical protein
MGKFDGVLLASDYDDTLYDKHLSISRENREAVDYFLREGGIFTVSTGRSLKNFSIQMELERLPVNAPVILANGAAIHDFSTGETLWQRTLPPAVAGHLAAVCGAVPQVGFEAYHQEADGGETVYTFRANAATEKHLKHCRLTGHPRELRDMPLPWIKVILQHMDTKVLMAAEDYMLNRWAGEYEITFSNPCLLEVTAKGANKGLCVQRVAERMGIDPKHIYCVGNGINDIPMLAISAIPFAPADCYDEVKEWGAELLPTCNESCVAELIRRLDEIY